MIQRSAYQEHCHKWREGCGSELCGKAHRVVLCRGSLPCAVLFVGEAPGESENTLGSPFVGPAGQLLDVIIKRGLPEGTRVAFTNLVGCIPYVEGYDFGKGRKAAEPPVEAIESCAPRLQELVNMAAPKMVVCVGAMARDWLKPGYKNPVVIPKHVKIIDITHPAHILRGNVAARGFAVQRCEVAVRCAWEELNEYVPPDEPLKTNLLGRDDEIPF